jgi:hypothetical protein
VAWGSASTFICAAKDSFSNVLSRWLFYVLIPLVCLSAVCWLCCWCQRWLLSFILNDKRLCSSFHSLDHYQWAERTSIFSLESHLSGSLITAVRLSWRTICLGTQPR